jgi:RNA polymerase sigma factor (sigma-70 family)
MLRSITVLRHCCIDLLRSRRAHVGLDHTELGGSASDTALAWQDLANALDRLDLQQAEILRLRYFGGLTYEELSQALAIPKGTLRLGIAPRGVPPDRTLDTSPDTFRPTPQR